MAIFHLSAKLISRKSGRSATAAAAYRAGVEIADERTGEVHDYTRKHGVEAAEIVIPDDAPAWAAERVALWNAVEAKNKRGDAQVAREIVIALPDELDAPERADLARTFAREIAQTYRIGVDLAIHRPGREGDQRNHHAHLLTTTNRLGPDGLGNKVRELDAIAHGRGGDKDRPKAIEQLRERWAALTNAALERAGRSERVDHRTLEAQGIEDREPTKHLGPGATALERKSGAPSRRRQDHQAEAAARLAAAREAGALERQAQAVEASILDLSGDMRAAVAARDQAQAREQARANREQIRQHFQRLALRNVEPGKAEAEAESWVRGRMLKLRERTERLTKRLEVQRQRLEARQRDHTQEAPSGLLRLSGRYGKAQAIYQAQGEALERRRRDLERRAGVVSRYQRPEIARETGERWVDRELPALRELAQQEKAQRIAERRGQLEQEREAKGRGPGRGRDDGWER